MKGTLSNLLIFTAGAAIGSVVTWKVIEGRYKKLVQEEVDSMDEYYRNKYGVEETEEDEENNVDSNTQIDIREYAAKLVKENYTNYSGAPKIEEKSKEVDDVEKPYVISPEEFGELHGYETVTLYYHADGVLTDDQHEPVEDADDVVGDDFATHFGEYEDDSVFIRNDAKCVDYEILYDPSTYHSGIDSKPHLAEDE